MNEKSNTELLEAYIDYLQYVRPVSKHTIISVRKIVPKFLKSIEDKHLSEIKIFEVEAYVANLRKRNLKDTTVKYYLVILNKFFSYLLDHEYITRNPVTAVMKAVRPYKAHQRQRRKRTLTPAQAGHLINVAHSSRMKAVLAIGFFTGMRIHEISELDVDSLDLDNMTIWVPVKGKRSYGELFITPECTRVIKRWLARREKLIKTGAYNKDEKALFINRGGRMTPEALGQAVAKVAVVAGFREPGGEGAKANGFHAHDMRYAFGNWLADASMPKEMIIKLRGDSGGTTFDDVYREIDTRVLKEEYLSRMPRLGIA
jgi:integrase